METDAETDAVALVLPSSEAVPLLCERKQEKGTGHVWVKGGTNHLALTRNFGTKILWFRSREALARQPIFE